VGLEKSNTVRFDELQKMLRLALELRGLPQGSAQQRRRALEGLAALVGAQVAIWVHVEGLRAGAGALPADLDLGGSGEPERTALRTYIDRQPCVAADPSMEPLTRTATGCTGWIDTFTCEQLVDYPTWCASELSQRFQPPAELGSFIHSTCAPGDDTLVGFSLHRRWGEHAFSERERRLVNLFHRECVFLHEPAGELSAAVLHGLPPRLRETLCGLARGRSEKQLAADAGLSPHTVHDYVKALHRHFGVQSRSELLARCFAGR